MTLLNKFVEHGGADERIQVFAIIALGEPTTANAIVALIDTLKLRAVTLEAWHYSNYKYACWMIDQMSIYKSADADREFLDNHFWS